jgi:hypothetical protein
MRKFIGLRERNSFDCYNTMTVACLKVRPTHACVVSSCHILEHSYICRRCVQGNKKNDETVLLRDPSYVRTPLEKKKGDTR